MNYLIDEQSQLTDLEPLFAQLHESASYVSVDTEFFREKTYNAKLCLVQLGIDQDQYCIDVLSIEDLSPLAKLFADKQVVKLFHAARQDLEVILQTLEVMPKPIFDTQLAAAFCGMDMQIGYSALVESKLNIELPKSQARTDWTRRPLSEAQLEYAADDVAHLYSLYQSGLADLTAQGKLEWYQQELEPYYDADKYNVDPAEAYKRLSGGALSMEQQYTLKDLAAWREETAQKRDIPRTWVMRDDRLFDLAIRRPQTEQEVKDLGVFGRKSANHLAPKAVQIIGDVQIGDDRLWTRVEPLDKKDKSVCSSMMKELTKYAEQHSVAQGLLATRRDVESLYRGSKTTRLLNGWREQLVGVPLQAFVAQSKS